MIQKSKHDRKRFINELQSRWQKKFRSSRNWLDDEELEALEQLDNFWSDPFSEQVDSQDRARRSRKIVSWS